MSSAPLIECRAAWRLARLAAHLAHGLLTVRFRFPRWDEARRRRAKRDWSARMLACLGVSLHGDGPPPPSGSLIVSNHVSWLDIFVINALTETHFVCKDEVRHWPIIGWLVENTGTIFIERGSRAAAARTAQTLSRAMADDERVVVFPEGTTTDGRSLLPFKSALFQSAVDAHAEVVPAVLRYRERDGHHSAAPAYDGDITMWHCLRAILRASGLHAELRFQSPLSADLGRRALAEQSWERIADGLDIRHDLPARQTQSQPEGGEA